MRRRLHRSSLTALASPCPRLSSARDGGPAQVPERGCGRRRGTACPPESAEARPGLLREGHAASTADVAGLAPASGTWPEPTGTARLRPLRPLNCHCPPRFPSVALIGSPRPAARRLPVRRGPARVRQRRGHTRPRSRLARPNAPRAGAPQPVSGKQPSLRDAARRAYGPGHDPPTAAGDAEDGAGPPDRQAGSRARAAAWPVRQTGPAGPRP